MPHVEQPDSPGSVELVRRQREQIDAQRIYVYVKLTHRLHRIRMECHPAFAGDVGQFPDRLHGPDLVVGHHDRHQHRVIAQRRPQVVGRDKSVAVHRQMGNFKALGRQRRAGVQHGVVLDLAGDDVPTPRGHGSRHTDNGQVVGLGPPGGHNELFDLAAQRPSHLLARVGRRLPRPPPHRMHAGRVAGVLGQVRHHRRQHLRRQRRRGAVIQVNQLAHLRPPARSLSGCMVLLPTIRPSPTRHHSFPAPGESFTKTAPRRPI